MGKVVQGVIGAGLVIFGGPVLGGIGWSLIVGNALSLVSQALVSKPRSRRLGQDIEYSGTVEPRRIIYGEMKVSGMNVIPPWTSGTGNKDLHQVLANTGHEVDDITDVYFGADVISDSIIGAVTGTLNDGLVSAGAYANKARIRRYLGTTSQTADFVLDTAFTQWTSLHRGREVSYVALQYELDDAVYKTGKPEVSWMCRGKKCYDPRLDTSPGANPTTAAYIAYTINPALCLADYLTSESIGLGEVATRIDWTLVVAAANICDESVTIPPTTTQRRYTCNVVLYVAITDEERRENIKTLAEAMMGHVVYRGGKWRMYAGAAATSTFALTENDLVGKLSIDTETSAKDKYNYVRGQFVDRDRAYQLSEFEPRSSSAYETTDGDRFPREVVFEACNNANEAQRNALIVLKRSRRKYRVTGQWGMPAYKIRPWDVGTLTIAELGWTAQPVRCIAWSFNPNGTIEVAFIDELASDWDDPAVGDYTVPTVGTGPGAGTFTPSNPLDFTVINALDGIQFHWNVPATSQVGLRYFIYEHTSATPFSSAIRVSPNLVGTSFFLSKPDQITRYYWVTAQYLQAGTESDPSPEGAGIAGASLAISAGFHVNLSVSSIYKTLTAVSSGNSGSITASPVNGTAPYTYSYTRLTGSATTTANTPTSATTNFHVTGMTANEQVELSTWRCTVTDSTAAIASKDFTVRFFRQDFL